MITSPQSSLLLVCVEHWKPPLVYITPDPQQNPEIHHSPGAMESSPFLPVPGPPQKPESSRSSPPLEPQHPRAAGDVLKERGSAPPSFPNPALAPLAPLSPLQGSVPAAS